MFICKSTYAIIILWPCIIYHNTVTSTLLCIEAKKVVKFLVTYYSFLFTYKHMTLYYRPSIGTKVHASTLKWVTQLHKAVILYGSV